MSEENVNVSAQEQEQEKVESFQPEPVKEEKSAPSGWKKIVGMVGIGCALAMVVLSVILIFMVGIDVVVTSGGETEVSESFGLFYYFEQFEKVIKAIENNPNMDPIVALVGVYNNMVGIVATMAFIVVSLIFAIIATIKSIIALVKGADNNYLKTAIVTYASFFAFALACVSIEGMFYSATYGGETTTACSTLNGAGMTGLILGGILLLASIGCKIATNVKEYVNTKTILSLVGTGVKVVVILIIVSLIGLSVSFIDDDASQHFSAFSIASMYAGDSEKQATISLLALVSTYVYIALVIITFIALKNAIADLTVIKNKTSLGLPIVIVIMTLLYTIFSLATAGAIKDLTGGSGDGIYGASYPIASFILALVYLAGAIVKNIGAKKAA